VVTGDFSPSASGRRHRRSFAAPTQGAETHALSDLQQDVITLVHGQDGKRLWTGRFDKSPFDAGGIFILFSGKR
jgi:hypothetical protein